MLSIEVTGENHADIIAKASIVAGDYFDCDPNDVKVHVMTARPAGLRYSAGKVQAYAFTADVVVYPV